MIKRLRLRTIRGRERVDAAMISSLLSGLVRSGVVYRALRQTDIISQCEKLMAVPILIPQPQFCDADGNPYAGGTIETYVPGTSTPKAVWIDPDGLAFQSNPIVLDAAGRCLWYGSGEYRLVLRDAAGNLVWDALSTTIVSAAMAPVVAAPTIADAVHQLGIDDLIAAEASARAAADSAEQAARIAADNVLTGLTTGLRTDLDAEIARALAASGDLRAMPALRLRLRRTCRTRSTARLVRRWCNPATPRQTGRARMP